MIVTLLFFAGEWVNKGDTFKAGYNCYVVVLKIGQEISDIINKVVRCGV